MSPLARFLFDECLGKPVMERLHQAVSSGAPFVHIRDYFHEGIKDREWVPRIASEGGWVVITSDGGKKSRKDEKLPALCTALGVTHLVLSQGLHDKKAHEKLAALEQLWPEIALMHNEPKIKGTRWNLRYKTAKRGAMTLLIEKLPFTSGPAK